VQEIMKIILQNFLSSVLSPFLKMFFLKRKRERTKILKEILKKFAPTFLFYFHSTSFQKEEKEEREGKKHTRGKNSCSHHKIITFFFPFVFWMRKKEVLQKKD